LLVVISILGILAYLTTPAIKNFGKSNATVSAARQLLDDVGRARQFAIGQRTTVYMVFVPTNFWADATGNPSTWFNNLTPTAQTAATNLCDKQLTGYTFMAYGAMGDQPGNHRWHYLAPWQNLPDGTFIALTKFTNSPSQSYRMNDPVSGALMFYINGFSVTNIIPFPVETNTVTTPPSISDLPYLPYIAFNYLGQLVSDVDASGNYRDAYIPLAKGGISLARDSATKALQFGPADVTEMPPGNSTNSSYNIIHIDRLTGRAVLEFQKLK
jgi:type II secretory pathway pseudopilin PulG